MPLGGIVTLAILLPNILILLLPPRDVPPKSAPKSGLMGIIEIVERIGQAGAFLIPFFYPLPALRETSVDALAVMVLALLFYYSGWMRYASKGHRYLLLYAPFLGIPLPMALSPVVYFASASVFLGSWPLAVATLLLALGHISVSYEAWNRCRVVGAA